MTQVPTTLTNALDHMALAWTVYGELRTVTAPPGLQAAALEQAQAAQRKVLELMQT